MGWFWGAPGINNIFGGRGNDEINGTDGVDHIYGRSGNDTLNGGAGNDHLIGGSGNDMLFGGEGNDLLKAGHGTDVLDGGAGNDRLVSGFGDDTLTGGTGADEFEFASFRGDNVVTDLSAEDNWNAGRYSFDLDYFTQNLTEVDGNAVLQLGSTGSITFEDATAELVIATYEDGLLLG